jgi:putative addiction module component (TIGR02574 family)
MLSDAEVLEQALVLPAAQRADIARKLLESLDTEPVDPGVDKAWADEVESRASAYDRGEVTALDADQVFDRARQSLRRGKAE